MARSGFRRLTSAEGLELFDVALGFGDSALVPVPLDTAALRAQGDSIHPLLRGLVRVPARRKAQDAASGETLARHLRGLAATDRREFLLTLVRTEAAGVLGLAGPAPVPAGGTFAAAGFDSLTGVDLRNRLSAATDLRLPATLIFDHPSPAALAGFLLDLLLPDDGGEAGEEERPDLVAEMDAEDLVRYVLGDIEA
ncbi:beta-ketoacyl reductase [Actinoallomurus purpureus]|nr:beta-ketoacyl reductase [Actinoallomurus purpureus]